MARKTKTKTETLENPPTSIEPYRVLGVDLKASEDQIKSAYRKQALRHHPDKAAPENREAAHKQFQEIAFAYAILSDERRRKRYDETGNTSESLDLEDDDFSWTDFFREQTAAMVDGAMIDKIKKEYQESSEEERDILAAYEAHEGDMDAIYEEVMCSSILDDDERFRRIIDRAIKEKRVTTHTKYTKESKASKRRRREAAKNEASEAMELAEELGVKEKLFGNGKTKQNGDEDALKALIMQRQKGRAENFFENLEAKYGAGGKGKRKAREEPSEEAFRQNSKARRKS